MRMVLAAALYGLLGPAAGAAQPVSEARPMSFEQCLATIRSVATQLQVAPVNIVETDILRMVRFPTADGSVLVSCSRPDQKIVITKSPHR